MERLVDHLADLTAQRDRDALDLALTTTIMDVLQPRSTAIHRAVGDAGNQHWRACARMQAGRQQGADPSWGDVDELPALAEFPLRLQALQGQKMQQARTDGDGECTVWPLAGTPGGPAGVLEVDSEAALTVHQQQLVRGILRLYGNFSGLLDYGERDSLTELLNRKTFDGAFLKATTDQQLATDPVAAEPPAGTGERRNARAAGSYWLAMIDIDHFKRVNDVYGHLIGDEVLLLLARLMRGHFRFHDQLYRFGGEEFVVLMRCRCEDEAARVLDRLCCTTRQRAFPQVGSISISIGFTEIRRGDSPSGAFERADKAVYYAKEHGRDQVCSHANLVARGELEGQAANVGEVELF